MTGTLGRSPGQPPGMRCVTWEQASASFPCGEGLGHRALRSWADGVFTVTCPNPRP